MKKFFFVLFLIGGVVPFICTAESLKNAGFIPANIWYSKDPFFAEEKIRIYTVVFNGSSYDLEGTVKFLDNGVLIGKVPFSLAGGGRVRDMWIDWKATFGRHIITAEIMDATASIAGEDRHAIVLDNTETGKSERNVDIDRELLLAIQQKAEAERKYASSTKGEGTIAGTIQKVGDYIPAPIKAGATVSANVIERFRIGEGYQFRLAKENKIREIDAMKSTPPPLQKNPTLLDSASATSKKPFAYGVLTILAALQYFFEWQIIFYGVLLYALYRFMKWIFVKIRNR